MEELQGPQPRGPWQASPLMQRVRWGRKTSPNLIKMLWKLETCTGDKVKGAGFVPPEVCMLPRITEVIKFKLLSLGRVTLASAESPVFTFQEKGKKTSWIRNRLISNLFFSLQNVI